mmetsp:Transcript_102370/g.285236  ORF Transcript_102370/g.285236 Transcript_102370/m.285236 type:complete len:259 (+) Transcript_102370:409-1185(+)
MLPAAASSFAGAGASTTFASAACAAVVSTAGLTLSSTSAGFALLLANSSSTTNRKRPPESTVSTLGVGAGSAASAALAGTAFLASLPSNSSRTASTFSGRAAGTSALSPGATIKRKCPSESRVSSVADLASSCWAGLPLTFSRNQLIQLLVVRLGGAASAVSRFGAKERPSQPARPAPASGRAAPCCKADPRVTLARGVRELRLNCPRNDGGTVAAGAHKMPRARSTPRPSKGTRRARPRTAPSPMAGAVRDPRFLPG